MSGSATTVPVVDFALQSGPFAEHPYPLLSELRETTPVVWHSGLQAYLVTRHADIRVVIHDEGKFVPSLPVAPHPARRNFIQMNGSEHRQYRAVMTPHFTRAALAQSVEPMLPALIDGLIDEFAGHGRVDLPIQFSNPIPAAVVRHMLQVPELDEITFMADTEIFLEHAADPTDPALAAAYPAAEERMKTFLSGAIRRHQETHPGGLLTYLVETTTNGQPLNYAEIEAFAAGVIVAGVETTQRLITNIMYALCAHPAQYRALLADRSLIDVTIEETLRYYPPNQFRMRTAIVDVDMHGVTIPEGARVYALTGGANRDPRVFDDPDVFNIHRPVSSLRHLSFGHGWHRCLGTTLARLEAHYALAGLLDRLGVCEFEPGHDIRFAGFRNRSPDHLWLTFTPLATPSRNGVHHN